MAWRGWFARLRALVRPRAAADDLDEELAWHLEREADRQMARGVGADEARAIARRAMGNAAATREAAREAWGWGWLDRLAQDVRSAVRALARAPRFVAAAVVTLGAGIGLSTAAFGVVNRLVLHPLPFADEERLRLVWMYDASTQLYMSPSGGEVAYWRAHTRTLDHVGELTQVRRFLSDGRETTVASVGVLAPEVLATLRVAPVMGRTFTDADTLAGAARVVMLGERRWRAAFGARRDIVGETVTLSDTSYTVVGVAPEQLDALFVYNTSDVWIPRRASGAPRGGAGVHVLARLRAGVSPEGARNELQLLEDRWRAETGQPPHSPAMPSVRFARPNDFLGPDFGVGLWVLFGATALVLLVASTNVANLQMVRSAHRAGEFAVRQALGGSRLRIGRQLFVESALLSGLGAAVGLGVASWTLWLVNALRPDALRQLAVVRFDANAFTFAVVATILTSVAYGFVPAFRWAGRDLTEALRRQAAAARATGRDRLRAMVVVAQVAVSLTMMVLAGLLVRRFTELRSADVGYESRGVVEVTVALPRSRYPDSTARGVFWRTFATRAGSLPGVALAEPTAATPLDVGLDVLDSVQVDGRAMRPGEGHASIAESGVPPGYFRLLRSHILEGRGLTADDAASGSDAAVIGASLARRYWPGESAIGHRIKTFKWSTVVGVVADQAARLTGEPGATDLQLYFAESPANAGTARTLLVRVTDDADERATLAALTAIVRAIDAHVPVTMAKSERQRIDEAQAQPRFVMELMSGFALVAMVLSMVGLYGVVAYAANRRRREIGVRLALGAQPADVVRLVVRDGARLALIGVVLGGATAFAATRAARGMLHGIGAPDPAVYAATSLLLLLAALVASYLPARRAARFDALVSLRSE